MKQNKKKIKDSEKERASRVRLDKIPSTQVGIPRKRIEESSQMGRISLSSEKSLNSILSGGDC